MVIAISCVQYLDLDELWVSYGIGKDHRFIPAHLIAHHKSRALLAFHALTGYDTTS